MIDQPETLVTFEFSRPLEISELEHGQIVRELTADTTELSALQQRYDVEALWSASASLTISPEAEGVVKVTGFVRADLSQICSVSLEAVEEAINEPVSITYLPPGVDEPNVATDSPLETQEDYEPFDGMSLELGEFVVQEIAAAIDPYPRKSGVVFGNQGQLGDNAPEERDNPFAVLQKLKGEGSQT
ncbi:MAG: DUF177 domain-containing protein [Alphaproteobacteria bacterium]|nr:DUF177 domain-containing protein [Alphaproteobacteria bacterium]